jgi:hypothetical protein
MKMGRLVSVIFILWFLYLFEENHPILVHALTKRRVPNEIQILLHSERDAKGTHFPVIPVNAVIVGRLTDVPNDLSSSLWHVILSLTARRAFPAGHHLCEERHVRDVRDVIKLSRRLAWVSISSSPYSLRL